MPVMQSLTPDQISRVVDEVVKKIQERVNTPQSNGEPATPQAKGSSCSGPSCECTECKTERTKSSRAMLEKGACRVGCGDPSSIHCEDIASYIDHTLLKPDAKEKEIEELCRQARQYHFASVCVNTSYVEQCATLLQGSGVLVCTVVGFPLGAMSSEAKAFETRDAVNHGADEIDMVINIGKLQSGNFAYVLDDIRSVVRAASGHTVKVIIETSMLDEDQKIAACVLSKAAGADFVKTSTGFGGGGATSEDIALMRRIVGANMGVKASGGIRDCATAQQMIQSGATRIGASASVTIVKGKEGKSGY
jgi:deoxyribose-phosphate aldolase